MLLNKLVGIDLNLDAHRFKYSTTLSSLLAKQTRNGTGSLQITRLCCKVGFISLLVIKIGDETILFGSRPSSVLEIFTIRP